MLRGAFAKRLSVLSLALLSRAYVMLEPSLRTAAVRAVGELDRGLAQIRV